MFVKGKGHKVIEIRSQVVWRHVVDVHIRGEAGVSPGVFYPGDETSEDRGRTQ